MQVAIELEFVPRMAEIAREAGALLREFFHRRVKIEYKGEADLVTEADRSSEKLILERIRSQWPDHEVIGERSNAREIQYLDVGRHLGFRGADGDEPSGGCSLNLTGFGRVCLGQTYSCPYRTTGRRRGWAYGPLKAMKTRTGSRTDSPLFSTVSDLYRSAPTW